MPMTWMQISQSESLFLGPAASDGDISGLLCPRNGLQP